MQIDGDLTFANIQKNDEGLISNSFEKRELDQRVSKMFEKSRITLCTQPIVGMSRPNFDYEVELEKTKEGECKANGKMKFKSETEDGKTQLGVEGSVNSDGECEGKITLKSKN